MTAAAAGRLALLAAAAAYAIAVAASLTGRAGTGRRALVVAAGLVGLATAALAWALVSGDFSLTYVADATSRAMTWPYRLGALWGGMEGSLLLWVLVLGGYGAVAASSLRTSAPGLQPGAQAVLAVLAGAFVVVVAAFADPFARLAVPATDGGGLTPVLEHPAMLYHPPLLYLGQAGLVVPFAITAAALARGAHALDGAWLAATRRAMAVAWGFLSLGMLAGAHWAYRELGWGGFWAWDPVENGSLLPWLGATAFLHAAVVTERRGAVRAWTAGLALGSFCLALLGGFLTRAGATDSVHAFAEARGVGAAFSGLLLAAAAGSAVLLAARRRRLGPGWAPPAAWSREAALLVNNALLCAAVVVVAAGTLAPVLSGWAFGRPAAVGARFFSTFTAPIALALLVLAGAGPLLPWSGRGPARLRSRLPVAAAGGLAGLAGTLALGFRGPLVLAGIPAGAASLALLAGEWSRLPTARARAGAVAHAGLVVLLIGVLGSTQGTEQAAVLRTGESVRVGGYTLTHEGVTVEVGERRREVRVRLAVLRSGRRVATLRPGLDSYEGAPAALPETALRSTAREDLLVTVRRIEPDGEAVVDVFVRPLVAWVWWGGLLLAAGGISAFYGPGSPPRPRRLRSRSRSSVAGGAVSPAA